MTKIDSFSLRDNRGYAIHGSVYKDGDEYALAVARIFSGYKRFKTLDAVYAYCEGRGLHVGLDRADLIRKRDRTVCSKDPRKTGADSSGMPAHIKKRMVERGLIKEVISSEDHSKVVVEIR